MRAHVTRGRRVGRALLVAGFAAFVASLAHTLGGGTAPGLLPVALSLLVSLPLAMLLAGGSHPWRTVISVLVAQGALHLLYTLGEGSATGTAPRQPAHEHGSPGLAAVLGGDGGAIAASGHSVVHTAWMPVAHLAAAALTIAALVWGDRAFAAIGRAIASSIRTVIDQPVAVPPASGVRVSRPTSSGFRPANLATLRASLRHRGPPLVLAAR